MQLDKPQGIDPNAPIKLEDAKQAMSTGVWPDDAAVQLVVQDCIRAESYEATKAWVAGWQVASLLYQSPFTARYWPGTQVEAASIPFYTVAKAVNSLAPKIVNGLFYEDPPFVIEKRPKTTAEAARAWGAVLSFQLDDINFREELRLGIRNALLFGTNIWKMGWESYTKERKVYRKKNPPAVIPSPLEGAGVKPIVLQDDEIEGDVIEESIERPCFEHIINLRHVLVDPGLLVPDIRKAKYVIHRMYLTWNDLDKLRDRPGYTIPSKEKILELFFPPKEEVEAATNEVQIRNPLWDMRGEPRYETTTVDPFNNQLEVLERWDNDKCMVVLQKKLLISNDDNQYGVIPFLSVGWWDVPEAFWSMGLSKTIGSEQRLQQGITNLWLDNAALNLNGVFVRVRGKNIPTQSIRVSPGKIVDVEDKDGFKTLDRLPAVPEAGQHLALSESRVEKNSGAGELSTQGTAGSSGHSNIARSAAGANLLSAGQDVAPEDFVEKLANQVLMPFLYFCQEQDAARLPVSTLKYILDDELEHEYTKQGGDLIDLLNARVKFSILAAAKMQSRRALAQGLPLILNFLGTPSMEQHLAMQGKKINFVEIIRLMFELSHFKGSNEVVVDMNAQDLQRYQMTQPGAQQNAKNQQAQQLQNQKYDREAEITDQNNTARAAKEVLRHALEAAETPEVLTGQAGGTFDTESQ